MRLFSIHLFIYTNIFFTKLGPYYINCSVTYFFSFNNWSWTFSPINKYTSMSFLFPWMILAVLFTLMAQIGYNPNVFQLVSGKQNVVYICTVEYYSTIKRNKLQVNTTHMQNHMLSEKAKPKSINTNIVKMQIEWPKNTWGWQMDCQEGRWNFWGWWKCPISWLQL